MNYEETGGSLPQWDPLLGRHVDRTVEAQEIWDKLSGFLGGVDMSLKANQSTDDFKQEVAEKYDEFIDLLDAQGTLLESTFFSTTRQGDTLYERSGEFLVDPVAALTTGEAFGVSENQERGVMPLVHLWLDLSGSMTYVDGLIGRFGRLIAENNLGEATQRSQTGLNQPLTILPRMFYASLVMRHLYKSLTEAKKQHGAQLEVHAGCFATRSYHGRSIEPYTGQVWITRETGGGTPIGPLLKASFDYEVEHDLTRAYRLDLIITDGLFDLSNLRGEEAADIQYQRSSAGGVVQSVVLNICDRKIYERDRPVDYELPPYFVQYFAGSPTILANVLDSVVTDFFVNTVNR